MTSKRWDFRDEDLRRYSVELEHWFCPATAGSSSNGREVFHGGKFTPTPAAQHGFDIEGHAALLRIRSNGFTYAFDLVRRWPHDPAARARRSRGRRSMHRSISRPGRTRARAGGAARRLRARAGTGPGDARARRAREARAERRPLVLLDRGPLRRELRPVPDGQRDRLRARHRDRLVPRRDPRRARRSVTGLDATRRRDRALRVLRHCARPRERSGRSSSAASSTLLDGLLFLLVRTGSGSPCTRSRCSRS